MNQPDRIRVIRCSLVVPGLVSRLDHYAGGHVAMIPKHRVLFREKIAPGAEGRVLPLPLRGGGESARRAPAGFARGDPRRAATPARRSSRARAAKAC